VAIGPGRPAVPPSARDEYAAAEQVMDLFASEALLALDKFERSFPPGDPAQPRQTADRLAYWWRRLGMDDVALSSDATDAQRILATAADLAMDPDNKWGVTIEEATSQASMRASLFDGRPVTQGVADLRRDFEESYGGALNLPRDDGWLSESLTRLARASVLREVVGMGAKAKVSEQARGAADELVRQGQRLMDNRRELAAKKAEPVGGRREYIAQQLNYQATYFLYSLGVELTHVPQWAELALKVPAGAYLLYKAIEAWADRRDAIDSRLDPAQAQLRAVRADLTRNLDGSSPLGQRDTRAIRAARGRDGGGWGR
jgi:hypothetical protein